MLDVETTLMKSQVKKGSTGGPDQLIGTDLVNKNILYQLYFIGSLDSILHSNPHAERGGNARIKTETKKDLT